eukprot:TRINITY_DN39143_c0_g3_i1.p1 TRINITY_DN39143_c0_g3~~TRINITY_DN39143_c0_g3_i1.p1  ORF type:complete len:201 (+),score=60.68 TRINITY_DN39143_c0_g3_i1:49-651(+)
MEDVKDYGSNGPGPASPRNFGVNKRTSLKSIKEGSQVAAAAAGDHYLGLDVEQVGRVREAFDFHDRDMKEELFAEDVQSVLHALGIQLTEDQNHRYLNRPGGPQRRVNFNDVLAFLHEVRSRIDREEEEARVAETFKVLDEDHDGRILIRDLWRFVEIFGHGSISPQDFNTLLGEFSLNDNSQLDLAGFKELMTPLYKFV